MTLLLESSSIPRVPEAAPNGFAELDARYAASQLSEAEVAIFGRWAISDTFILEVPESLRAQGIVQTNPSQVEITHGLVNGETEQFLFAYVRQERELLHIGTTTALPYLLRTNNQEKPYLVEFPDADAVPGEDPRLTAGVKLPRLLRSKNPFRGWMISTVEATPRVNLPDEAASITQKFYWSETLRNFEQVAEIHESKNTDPLPRYGAEDVTVDVFTRPFPAMAHMTLPDVTYINDERVYNVDNIITKPFYPDHVHMGPNKSFRSANPGFVSIYTHEAYRAKNSAGKTVLHYRLAQAGFELPTRTLPLGRFIPIGVLATRSQFPQAEPKPADRYVGDYRDILYGSPGSTEWMLVGVGDNRIGAAKVIKS